MAGRHKKKRGRKGTGKPDPSKDRTEHEAARGVKKAPSSLRDLSKVLDLSEHVQDIIHELDSQTDRGLALIATALVDVSLTRLMMCRVLDYEGAADTIFYNEGAPLSSFSARIKVARAIGVIGPYTEQHLDALRRIRNQFAHSPLKIDFANPLIAAEIDKLLPDNPKWRPDLPTERRRFLGTATVLIEAMAVREEEHRLDPIPMWMM
jgi:DNA-binding MltR family transcriptional regulator